MLYIPLLVTEHAVHTVTCHWTCCTYSYLSLNMLYILLLVTEHAVHTVTCHWTCCTYCYLSLNMLYILLLVTEHAVHTFCAINLFSEGFTLQNSQLLNDIAWRHFVLNLDIIGQQIWRVRQTLVCARQWGVFGLALRTFHEIRAFFGRFLKINSTRNFTTTRKTA
jgi:hypothetical protein